MATLRKRLAATIRPTNGNKSLGISMVMRFFDLSCSVNCFCDYGEVMEGRQSLTDEEFGDLFSQVLKETAVGVRKD